MKVRISLILGAVLIALLVTVTCGARRSDARVNPNPGSNSGDESVPDSESNADTEFGNSNERLIEVEMAEGHEVFFMDFCVDGNYAYVLEHDNGLIICDLGDPTNTFWFVWSGEGADRGTWRHFAIVVSDGYAYVACGSGELRILDVEPPESTNVVGTLVGEIENQSIFNVVAVSDSHEYLCAGGSSQYGFPGGRMHVVDISPPESAHIVGTIKGGWQLRGVVISGGYAYMANEFGLEVVDIDPPESAHSVIRVDTYEEQEKGCALDVAVSGGYAYLAAGDQGGMCWAQEDSGLEIIDIDPPESAHIIRTVVLEDNRAQQVVVSGGYAYVESADSHLQIVDIDPPESAHVVDYFPEGYRSMQHYALWGGNLYILEHGEGLRITEIRDIEELL